VGSLSALKSRDQLWKARSFPIAVKFSCVGLRQRSTWEGANGSASLAKQTKRTMHLVRCLGLIQTLLKSFSLYPSLNVLNLLLIPALER